jgi:hypothetical protein
VTSRAYHTETKIENVEVLCLQSEIWLLVQFPDYLPSKASLIYAKMERFKASKLAKVLETFCNNFKNNC